jgi:acyl-CoA thioesterase
MADGGGSEERLRIEALFAHDHFSQWLGVKILDVRPGYSKLELVVRPEMVNGFGIAHGGIVYSLADTALAFASNGSGETALSIENTICYSSTVKVGERVCAVGSRRSESKKLGVYDVEVFGENERLVALFRGTVYRPSQKGKSETP